MISPRYDYKMMSSSWRKGKCKNIAHPIEFDVNNKNQREQEVKNADVVKIVFDFVVLGLVPITSCSNAKGRRHLPTGLKTNTWRIGHVWLGHHVFLFLVA